MDISIGERMKITILGARGSIPTEGADMLEFGGATSCVLIETDTEAVFFDAGTGIMKSPDIGDKNISLFLTHPHLDHLLGLPFFPYIFKKEKKIDFYAAENSCMSAKKQLSLMMSPPLWPCTTDEYPANFVFHDIAFPVRINGMVIEGIPSVHPGGGVVYKLTCKEKTVVYATDYEYDEEKIGELIDFAEDADLLLFDAQYTDEEFAKKKGFGHSTPAQGLEVAKKCGAKTVRFVHHDPGHSDEFLLKMEAEIKTDTIAFARRGEVIYL